MASSCAQDLNRIVDRLSEESFLQNKGLSNEVGIHVFCYDPGEEMMVNHFFQSLKKEMEISNIPTCIQKLYGFQHKMLRC